MSLTAYSTETGGFVLHANDEAIGWIEGRGIGFRRSGSRGEAIAAAIVAHEALERWAERERLADPAARPVSEITVRPDGTHEWLVADGRPIGQVIAPEADAHPGRAFGFELYLPRRVSAVTALGAAHVMYNALTRTPGSYDPMHVRLAGSNFSGDGAEGPRAEL